ncbi:beta-ketoacyl synthase N-terminal-like domain-containing protein [Streptomyces sp. NPDC048420]|uniref:type I polyketide synthase n=1 Tax=Streptomyces sp. NPDC048420 TaxID=3155755 RepID=UPI0034431767
MAQSHPVGPIPVAIVGMGCRFPQASGVPELWANLLANIDSITPVPSDRFDIDRHYSPTPEAYGKTISRHGGFLSDPFAFDAGFFGISPVEAATMDPQQRILLHVVWEALEDAGIRPSTLAGSRSGVFVGQATAEYSETQPPTGGPSVREAAGSRLRAVTAGRVSYALDLHGPSVVLDTACSSSLVAVHHARQSLLSGESDLAVAGGVNIILSPHDAIAYSHSGMLSPGGRCRFGDASGDGFVRSEGIGVVILKRLADAERDGDPVRAVLLGTAVTNDGRGSGLLLKPSVSGQTHMIEEACRAAGVTPGQIDYVEAHGTGTPVGDGVELSALAAANDGTRTVRRPLRTGSVKSNIGHTEAAAGIAGLIKAVLIAEHGTIPASLHCGQPHPLLAEGKVPVRVVTANEPLDKAGPQALVSVSSFGLSGTNAHAIIGEFTGTAAPPAHARHHGGAAAARETSLPRRPPLLVLSARSRESLRRLAQAYAEHLGGAGREYALDELCAAAALRRDHHPFRMWATGATHEQMAAHLLALSRGEQILEGGTGEAGFGHERPTVLVFPGQGSQWQGMARGLLAASPAFRSALTECDSLVRAELDWSPLDLLNSDLEFPHTVEKVQPTLWAVQVALTEALRDAGVRPDVCVGHSMGEVAAAQACGALTLRDAASVICRRSRLMGRVAGRGGMLVVGLPSDEVQQAVAGRTGVCVAAENAPSMTVLAGPVPELERLAEEWDAHGVLCRPVNVDVPSHSPVMEEVREDLLAALDSVRPRAALLGMISTARGADLRGPELDAGYWADNLCRPVRFTDAVHAAAKAAESVFVEVSPHPVLTAAMRETLTVHGASGTVVATLHRGQDEPAALAHSVGQIFVSGGAVDWTRWFGRTVARPVRLPHYTWDTTRYPPSTSSSGDPDNDAYVRTYPLARWGADAWGDALSVRGATPVPPVVHLTALWEAAGRTAVLRGVRLGTQPLDSAEAGTRSLTVRVGADRGDGTRPVSVVSSTAAGTTVVHATGTACAQPARDEAECNGPGLRPVDAALSRCGDYVTGRRFDELARGQGVEIGPGLRSVEQLWRRDGEVVARLRRPSLSGPVAWEAALLPLLAAWPQAGATDVDGCTLVPEEFGEVRIVQELPPEFWSVGTVVPAGPDGDRADVQVYAPDGRILASFQGIRMRWLPGCAAAARTGPLPSAVSTTARVVTSWLTQQFLPPVVSRALGALERAASRSGPTAERLVAESFPVEPVAGPEAGPAAGGTGCETPQADPPGSGAAAGQDPGQGPGEALLTRASAVLGMPPADLDTRRPLRDLGLDSLMAMQLRRQLLGDLGMDITLQRLLGAEPVDRLMADVAASGR